MLTGRKRFDANNPLPKAGSGGNRIVCDSLSGKRMTPGYDAPTDTGGESSPAAAVTRTGPEAEG